MLTQRRHESGLVLAEEAADEQAVTRALKRLHPDFALHYRPRDEAKGGVLVYKVVHVPSGRVAFTWTDRYGRPLPLSSGLIDEFQRHLLGERGNASLVGDDEHNRRHLAQLERRQQADVEAIRGEHAGRLADRLTVSMSGTVKRRKTDRGPAGPRATPWRRKP